MANTHQVIRVTVPGPQGPTGGQASAANINLNDISNVDITSGTLNDGAILQYKHDTGKWVARNELDTSGSSTIVLNSGSF